MQQWYQCPRCGAQVAFGVGFCNNCGTQLNWPTQQPPQPPPSYQQQQILSKEENEAVERNLRGRELERQGNITDAIKLYEINIANEFDGNFPYDRLRVIYSKQGRYGDVIRILKKAIDVFDTKVYPSRPDRLPKLEKFRRELEKAESKL